MQFRQDVSRHGLWPTLRALVIRMVGRVVPIAIAEVSSSNNVADHPLLEGYENRLVDDAEFHAALEADQPDRHAAFARGDLCVATFFVGGDAADQMVGFNFYSNCPTKVDDATEFFFPSSYQYSYAAFTADAHRGLRLSPSRWTFARDLRKAQGNNCPTIYYIELTNLPSLSSGKPSDREMMGYTGYVKLGKRLYYWCSPGCKRHGAGFRQLS